MKLRQGQIWKLDEQYIRIVVLERLAVEYKILKDLQSRDGTRHQATKKKFCALIKKATLLTPVAEPEPIPETVDELLP